VTYRSAGLAAELGLRNLYISFSGYWPEIGARTATCTFKDLEAPPTLQRLMERNDDSVLTVASAGNTARAFAQAASVSKLPLVLVVPESALSRIWITTEPGPITLIGVRGDYYDAILSAERIISLPGFVPEGGARNVARRDGMGTVVLEAALTSGKLPDHYFQAVGSGTGGIAAWESSMRLMRDGRFGQGLPRLHQAQSLPNAPIYNSWKDCKGEYCRADETFDDVLFNRKPPYTIPGGVCDALKATNGEVYGVSNQEASEAKKMFEVCEDIDILNAPAVAVAALKQAIDSGSVRLYDTILLNITGGGLARLKEEMCLNMLKPDLVISSPDEAVDYLGNFSKDFLEVKP
jgi:cysteate synthase